MHSHVTAALKDRDRMHFSPDCGGVIPAERPRRESRKPVTTGSARRSASATSLARDYWIVRLRGR